MLRFFFIRCTFTVDILANNRKLTNLKICYKPKLDFLKFKINLTNSISNRLVINSDYLRSYKNLRYFYIHTMRTNFKKEVNINFFLYFLRTFDNKRFLINYIKTKMMRELDYALLWRGGQINALFNIFIKTTKERKKITVSNRVVFIPIHKRMLFVWKWLAIFINSLCAKGVPRHLSLKKGFENFFFAPKESHVLTEYKFYIYKIHLLRAI